MLPLREPTRHDFVEAMRSAVRRAGNVAGVERAQSSTHQTPQLLLFASGAGKEASQDLTPDLINAGFQETMHIIIEIAAGRERP